MLVRGSATARLRARARSDPDVDVASGQGPAIHAAHDQVVGQRESGQVVLELATGQAQIER